MSREERLQRDQEQNPKRQKTGSDDEESVPQRNIGRAMKDQDEGKAALRPGEKGWVARARVPAPSNKDYVNRPRWKVDTDISRVSRLIFYSPHGIGSLPSISRQFWFGKV